MSAVHWFLALMDSRNPEQSGAGLFLSNLESMVVSGSRSKGGIGSIWAVPEGKDYKWYISGI